MKNSQDKDFKIIISEENYPEFQKSTTENNLDLNIFPKIIILTNNEMIAMEKNQEYQENQNSYQNENINKSDEVQKILNAQPQIIKQPEVKKRILFNFEVQLTFEYIDNKKKLMLPIFFKSLIEKVKIDDQYTFSLFEKYSKENEQIQNILNEIESNPNITLEELSRYYVRLYSIESDFYKDINESLRAEKSDKSNKYINRNRLKNFYLLLKYYTKE